MTTAKALQNSFLVVLVAIVLLTCGCIERKLTINTQPQGAMVILNDEQIGVSPVTVNFRWYGDYKYQISREGYETITGHRKLDAPTHDKFPFDFFYGVLWPGRVVDEYEWTFELAPFELVDRDELIDSALEIRSEALTGKAVLETDREQQ